MSRMNKIILIIISLSATLGAADEKIQVNLYEKVVSITNEKLKNDKDYVSILKEFNPTKSLELANFINKHHKSNKPLEKILMSYNKKLQKPQLDFEGISVVINEYDTFNNTLLVEINQKPLSFSINDSLDKTLVKLNSLIKKPTETSNFNYLDLIISPAYSNPFFVASVVGLVAAIAVDTYILYEMTLKDIDLKTEFMKMRFEKFKPKIEEIISECRKFEYSGKSLQVSELKKMNFAREQLQDIKNEFSDYFVKFSGYHWNPAINSAMECIESVISNNDPNVASRARVHTPRTHFKSGQALPPVRKIITKEK